MSARSALTLRHLTVLVAALLALLVASGGERASAAGYWGPGYRICGSFKVRYGPLYVSAKGIGCRKATRVLKEWWKGPDSRQTFVDDSTGAHVLLDRFPGWVCADGASAGSCSKGGRYAAYNFFEPRLASSFPGLRRAGPLSSCPSFRSHGSSFRSIERQRHRRPTCWFRPPATTVEVAAAAPRLAAGARPLPTVECLVDGRQTYQVAPKGCVMYEHGSPATTILAAMDWRDWGKRRTRGRGVIHFFDHPEYSGRVLVRLSRIAAGHCVPGRYYTRARIKVRSGRAKGNAFTLNLAAGCPA